MPEGIFCLKHMKKFLLAVLLVLIVLPAAYCFAASNNVVSTLDKAGLENVIRSNKGKPVIVNFFATWCPPCRGEIPLLVKMQAKYGNKVAFIGLSVDDSATSSKVGPFMKSFGANYPVYLADRGLVDLFGISSIPFNVIYGHDGKLLVTGSGAPSEDEFDQILSPLLNK